MAAAGEEIVVTDGVYPGGVTVTKPLTLLSVNGPQFTAIDRPGWTVLKSTLLARALIRGNPSVPQKRSPDESKNDKIGDRQRDMAKKFFQAGLLSRKERR